MPVSDVFLAEFDLIDDYNAPHDNFNMEMNSIHLGTILRSVQMMILMRMSLVDLIASFVLAVSSFSILRALAVLLV